MTTAVSTRGHEFAEGKLLPSAEYYAKVGWKVFPCVGISGGKCLCGTSHPAPKDMGKHPFKGSRGQDDCTDDLDKVHEWWVKHPDANIGVHCAESGFVVIDVDPRSGGFESWEVLESQTGGMPATVEAQTGEYMTVRGGAKRGRHLFYRVNPGEVFLGHPGGPSGGLKGIDVKHKGYVLIAPSRHGSGRVYEWAPGKAPWERAMTEAPDELLKLIRKNPLRSVPTGTGSSESGYGIFEWDGEKVDIDALLEAGIYEGERVNKLHLIALSMSNKYPVGTGHGRGAVKYNMAVINRTRTFPPLDESELNMHVERAMNHVRDNPVAKMVTSAVLPAMEWVKDQEEAGTTIQEKPAAATRNETPPGTIPVNPADALPPDIDEWGNDADEESGIVRRTLTDRGNARRLRDFYAGKIRYTEGMGWFIWNGSYWEPDGEGLGVLEKTQALAAIISREMLGLIPGDEDWKRVAAWVTQSKSTAKMKSCIDQWKADSELTRVAVEAWDSNPQYLGVLNGVIDLRSGALLKGTPEMGITKRTDVGYTAGTTNVRWTEFLEFATGGDKELQGWLQKAAGYTLTGMRHHDVLFMVFGQPGSGKSTFLEALGHALGKGYMTAMNSSVLVDDGMKSSSDEYHWASLRGKRMVVFSEWPHGKKTKEDAVKRLTGDMTIQARNPAEKPFNFESQAKLWIGTNSLPWISDEAMWRRIRAIPFPNVPGAPDPDLKPYLMDPEGGLPAVLSWAVEGAVRLINSADKDSLGWCRAVKSASADYRKSEDRMGMFLEEETELSPGASVPVKVLHDVHRMWSEDRGEQAMTATPFKKALQERGLRVDGMGRRAILHDRRLLPRVAEAPVGTPDWADLTRFSR